MKKILIAAGAVVFAAVSQAAALSWNAYGALNEGEADEDWYTGGQAYLVLVTDAASFAVDSSLNITGGSVVHSGNIDGGYAAGAIDSGEVIAGGLVSGTQYSFAVLFTTEGAAGSAMPTTGLYGLNDNDGALYTITWNGDTGASFFNEETWAAVVNEVAGAPGPGPSPIPEPTSGLLMLLGMAGLALRRRRA